MKGVDGSIRMLYVVHWPLWAVGLASAITPAAPLVKNGKIKQSIVHWCFARGAKWKVEDTVKAALDELFDHGRPAKVELAVLADRGGRTLPFAADYTGLVVAAAPEEKVTVVLHATDPGNDSITVARPAK